MFRRGSNLLSTPRGPWPRSTRTLLRDERRWAPPPSRWTQNRRCRPPWKLPSRAPPLARSSTQETTRLSPGDAKTLQSIGLALAFPVAASFGHWPATLVMAPTNPPGWPGENDANAKESTVKNTGAGPGTPLSDKPSRKLKEDGKPTARTNTLTSWLQSAGGAMGETVDYIVPAEPPPSLGSGKPTHRRPQNRRTYYNILSCTDQSDAHGGEKAASEVYDWNGTQGTENACQAGSGPA